MMVMMLPPDASAELAILGIDLVGDSPVGFAASQLDTDSGALLEAEALLVIEPSLAPMSYMRSMASHHRHCQHQQ